MIANAALLASNKSLTDAMVISSVLGGKKDDYAILVRRYNNMLYKTAKGILSREEDIEDAMQEAYIKGFEKLYQFESKAKFSTWLTRILINCALLHLSRSKDKGHQSLDTIQEEATHQLQEIPSENPSPEVGENLKKAVEGAIGHLPTKYRIVFVLREVEQHSVAEVASLLEISEDNVKIRLHRAKSMLKDILRAELNSLELFVFHASRCALLAEKVMNHISTGIGTFGLPGRY